MSSPCQLCKKPITKITPNPLWTFLCHTCFSKLLERALYMDGSVGRNLSIAYEDARQELSV